MKTTEEFGQALQNIIDRHRQDLSILLRGYGFEEHISPADLVMLYQQDPMILMELQELPLTDDDLCHFEGETTLDKISKLFISGFDLLKKDIGSEKVRVSPSEVGSQDQHDPPASNFSKKARTYIIVGLILAIVLTLILIMLKRKR